MMPTNGNGFSNPNAQFLPGNVSRNYRPRSGVKNGAPRILRPLLLDTLEMPNQGGSVSPRYPYIPGGASVTTISPLTVMSSPQFGGGGIGSNSQSSSLPSLSALTISISCTPRKDDLFEPGSASRKPMAFLGASEFVTKKGTHYTRKGILGKGTFGAVEEVRSVTTGNVYALKMVPVDAKNSADGKSVTEPEVVGILGKHPTIVNCRKVGNFSVENEGHGVQSGTYFLMEKAECDLTTLLKSEIPVSEPILAQIMSDMMKALIHLAQYGIVHTDTKPGNILMFSGTDKNGEPFTVFKLADFGSARRVGDPINSIPGSLPYASPEVLSFEAPTHASDVFSLALTFYQLATKTTFVPDMSGNPIALYGFYTEESHPDKLASATEALKRSLGNDSKLIPLIIGMLALSPEGRLRPADVLHSLS